LAKQAQDEVRSVHYGANGHLHDGVTLLARPATRCSETVRLAAAKQRADNGALDSRIPGSADVKYRDRRTYN
jgi:hypothetical protein